MTTTMPPEPRNEHKRGDVILVLYPHSDLLRAKTRPAVVVQADRLESGLNQVVVAMISGKLFRAGHASRVTVRLNDPHGSRSGLLTDSVVMTDNLATVSAVAVDRVIGTLPMAEIDRALRHTLGL